MGKIAYGRRRTEKRTGIRNETYVVVQIRDGFQSMLMEFIILGQLRI